MLGMYSKIWLIDLKIFIHNYRQKAKENELYVLPDLLKSAVSKVKKTEDMLSNQMLSGIPEIDLGIE